MDNATKQLSRIREHTRQLLSAIGVSRIVVVDDEYREGDVEEVIGLCAGLPPDQAVELPLLDDIDFDADYEIWSALLREKWKTLDDDDHEAIIARGRAIDAVMLEATKQGDVIDTANGRVDAEASRSLGHILDQLHGCEFVPLSLRKWRARKDELIEDARARDTVFLFDRDFTKEEGTDSEGIDLIRHVQAADVGYCGLLSHTVTRKSEHLIWRELAEQYGLNRDTFVVIAKERLTDEAKDYWKFLRMLRFVGLSARYAKVVTATWSVLDEAIAAAKGVVEWLPLSDFDTMVFESSRKEGVWEPDTLIRVFGIVMRREVQRLLRQNVSLSADVSEARRISILSEKLAKAMGAEEASDEALLMQRREMYQSANDLNRCHIPIGNGDIFKTGGNGHRYVLLAQPCDLMVRPNGKRNYDKNCGRTGVLVQIVLDVEKKKESWKELVMYDVEAGKRTFVDFANAHQVLLAALDLCVFQEDGAAKFEAAGVCPELVIQPWRKRYNRLAMLFHGAIEGYEELASMDVREELTKLALPRFSATLEVLADAGNGAIDYGLVRVGRVRQPWSEALLTGLTQYHARAAFEHALERGHPATAGG